MKYYVTYCITHPEHTPTTATGMVEARTRPDLEVRLARGVGKWKKHGYTVEIVKVATIEDGQSTVMSSGALTPNTIERARKDRPH